MFSTVSINLGKIIASNFGLNFCKDLKSPMHQYNDASIVTNTQDRLPRQTALGSLQNLLQELMQDIPQDESVYLVEFLQQLHEACDHDKINKSYPLITTNLFMQKQEILNTLPTMNHKVVIPQDSVKFCNNLDNLSAKIASKAEQLCHETQIYTELTPLAEKIAQDSRKIYATLHHINQIICTSYEDLFEEEPCYQRLKILSRHMVNNTSAIYQELELVLPQMITKIQAIHTALCGPSAILNAASQAMRIDTNSNYEELLQEIQAILRHIKNQPGKMKDTLKAITDHAKHSYTKMLTEVKTLHADLENSDNAARQDIISAHILEKTLALHMELEQSYTRISADISAIYPEPNQYCTQLNETIQAICLEISTGYEELSEALHTINLETNNDNIAICSLIKNIYIDCLEKQYNEVLLNIIIDSARISCQLEQICKHTLPLHEQTTNKYAQMLQKMPYIPPISSNTARSEQSAAAPDASDKLHNKLHQLNACYTMIMVLDKTKLRIQQHHSNTAYRIAGLISVNLLATLTLMALTLLSITISSVQLLLIIGGISLLSHWIAKSASTLSAQEFTAKLVEFSCT